MTVGDEPVRAADGTRRVAAVGVAELAPGGTVVLAADRTGWSASITVFRDADAFFALDDTCSHAEASLSEGFVDDGCVECPLHGALFRLSDGAALTLPAVRAVRTHRVEIEGGVVWVCPGAPA